MGPTQVGFTPESGLRREAPLALKRNSDQLILFLLAFFL